MGVVGGRSAVLGLAIAVGLPGSHPGIAACCENAIRGGDASHAGETIGRHCQNSHSCSQTAKDVFEIVDYLSGGAEGDRTPDLVNAIHALSQLSYGPCSQAGDAEGGAGPLTYDGARECASGVPLRKGFRTAMCAKTPARASLRSRACSYCGSSGSATGPPMMFDISEPSSSSSSRKVSSSSAVGSVSPSTSASTSSSPSASGASGGLMPSTG